MFQVGDIVQRCYLRDYADMFADHSDELGTVIMTMYGEADPERLQGIRLKYIKVYWMRSERYQIHLVNIAKQRLKIISRA